MYKKSLFKGWLIYVGIIVFELFIDYLLRGSSESFYADGIPEAIWFLVQFLALLAGGYYWVMGVFLLQKTSQIIIHLTLNFVAAASVYFILVYGYVLGIGIDSF